MNESTALSSKIAFWGICIIATGWLIATAAFEVHFGLPTTGIQFAKRLVGWAVELWLFRTLRVGFQRYHPTTQK